MSSSFSVAALALSRRTWLLCSCPWSSLQPRFKHPPLTRKEAQTSSGYPSLKPRSAGGGRVGLCRIWGTGVGGPSNPGSFWPRLFKPKRGGSTERSKTPNGGLPGFEKRLARVLGKFEDVWDPSIVYDAVLAPVTTVPEDQTNTRILQTMFHRTPSCWT